MASGPPPEPSRPAASVWTLPVARCGTGVPGPGRAGARCHAPLWLTGPVISPEVFRGQPVLTGTVVRLEPLGLRHFEGLGRGRFDPEVTRLTGGTATITEEQARQWVATRADHHDRADWAIVRQQDGAILGEAVLNELDPHNASVNFRILLVRPQEFGRGYGTEATRLVLDYGLDVAGLHRIGLEVYDFNPRAQRVYEKCGFVTEGRRRDALCWDGEWHDAIVMAILATDPRPWLASPPDGQTVAAGALGDGLLAARRRLGSLDLAPAERARLERRLTAICDATKSPGADTGRGERRLREFLTELDQTDTRRA